MSITLDQITKRYQNTPVVNDVSLDVGDGEFFVLLGASGSGKSTLLRAIAGLTGVDHGRISLHGRDVTHMSPRKREVGLVFQNYALFKHMSVADNIEFALRVRNVKAVERRERRKELLRLVALEGMDDRLPTQLSGGQQQRVAVARALAHKPQVLLMDEPFGALDAKIREELRTTIRQVQRELKISTILVTHDQEEAFALADRIGVMNLGRLLEVGRPEELYARPATRFVATFLGAANLLLARQTADGIRVGATPVTAPLDKLWDQRAMQREHEVVAVLRPEEVALAADRDTLNTIYLGNGVVESTLFTGAYERLRVRMTEPDKSTVAADGVVPTDTSHLATLDVTRSQHDQRQLPLLPGQSVAVGVRRIHVLPTPLSSYVAYAKSDAKADSLKAHPFLVELALRMKTRITTQVEPQLGARNTPVQNAALAGVAVLHAHSHSPAELEWLLRQGASEVLLLPEANVQPRRVLIHWTDDAVRHATLAVAASVLRHVAAEATYLNILPPNKEAQKSDGMRELLDARSTAQAAHGLEMRTELHFGDVSGELSRQLAISPDQMLILGISNVDDVHERFTSLLKHSHNYPVLVVFRERGAS
ncbi:MAG TPA: ABC transporter ATP-binding protein [Steroidobacteraceae bacterium]|nr:ABC transporter ATP-binding protein [Steroidobacteraceae bacterium]